MKDDLNFTRDGEECTRCPSISSIDDASAMKISGDTIDCLSSSKLDEPVILVIVMAVEVISAVNSSTDAMLIVSIELKISVTSTFVAKVIVVLAVFVDGIKMIHRFNKE